jgi:hypothetical protein
MAAAFCREFWKRTLFRKREIAVPIIHQDRDYLVV